VLFRSYRNGDEITSCSEWFHALGLPHFVLDRRPAVERGNRQAPPAQAPKKRRGSEPDRPVLPPGLDPWLRFQDAGRYACFATGESARGLLSVRRLHVIYTFCPSPTLLDHTCMGSNHIVVCVSPRESGKVGDLPQDFWDADLICQ
jgi:hypothetical protein